MDTKANQSFICIGEGVNDRELDAILLYWEFNFDELKFVNKVMDIKQKFALELSNIPSLVRAKSSFSCDLPNFQCNVCGEHKSIKIRSDFSEQANQYGYTCESCLTKREKEILSQFVEVVDKYTTDLYDSSFDYTTLSYLEKLVLFLLISEYHKEDGKPLYCDAKRFSLTGCHSTDKNFLTTFLKKGAILIVDEVSDEIKQLKSEFHKIRDMLFKFHESAKSHAVRANYRCNEMDAYASGMYLRFSDYDTAVELQSALYADICEKKIKKSDIEDFQFLIEQVRTNVIHDIVDEYAYEFNFSVDRSLKLDNVLKYLGKNYQLNVISYFLYKRAEFVASELHKDPVPKYIENKKYAKQIDDYLTLCKSKNWTISYTRRLPFDIDTSLLESFVCNHFFDNCLNWFELTTSEIVEQWLESMVLSDKQELGMNEVPKS